ncbi:MAG TPA: ABC transporter ATP-binding protein [Chitinophagaceae bacterium]|nr:ABC transporter ATP-binding protein [Chitinophagaceae bacterium]
MSSIIEIRGLGKKYKLAEAQQYLALRDIISNAGKQLFSKKQKEKEFWALQDIDLDIQPGERVGIIGRNGAGKSTLLKILSRITPPTTGNITIHGRVASLLEVGTGFHPELTGKENIYLNGSILGLKKSEIKRRLDEIIDFSGVEKFIDTPLKHYSNGMQLRLAFSVAAHLEPEILLIDEVLAVGDAEFQKKCIGRMEEISKTEGRTILFVSHNMAIVKKLCTRGVVIDQGKLNYNGDVGKSIQYYSDNNRNLVHKGNNGLYDLQQHPNKADKSQGLLSAEIRIKGTVSETASPGDSLEITVTYYTTTKLLDAELGIVIKDSEHSPLIGLNNKHLGTTINIQMGEKAKAVINIPHMNIYSPGTYFIDLYFGDGYHFYECLYDALSFTIVETDVFKSGTTVKPEWNKIFFSDMEIKTI